MTEAVQKCKQNKLDTHKYNLGNNEHDSAKYVVIFILSHYKVVEPGVSKNQTGSNT